MSALHVINDCAVASNALFVIGGSAKCGLNPHQRAVP